MALLARTTREGGEPSFSRRPLGATGPPSYNAESACRIYEPDLPDGRIALDDVLGSIETKRMAAEVVNIDFAV
jgi:hypothetical protein